MAKENNVVEWPVTLKTISIPLARFMGAEAVGTISREVTRWMRDTKQPSRTEGIRALAAKAQLANTTVTRIMERKTQEPRLTTIVSLLIALDFKAAKFTKED